MFAVCKFTFYSTWDEESQHIHVVLTTKSFTLQNKLKKKKKAVG